MDIQAFISQEQRKQNKRICRALLKIQSGKKVGKGMSENLYLSALVVNCNAGITPEGQKFLNQFS